MIGLGGVSSVTRSRPCVATDQSMNEFSIRLLVQGKPSSRTQTHFVILTDSGRLSRLFIGSGYSLSVCGPVAIFLGYVVMGLVLWSVMECLGELSTLYPG